MHPRPIYPDWYSHFRRHARPHLRPTIADLYQARRPWWCFWLPHPLWAYIPVHAVEIVQLSLWSSRCQAAAEWCNKTWPWPDHTPVRQNTNGKEVPVEFTEAKTSAGPSRGKKVKRWDDRNVRLSDRRQKSRGTKMWGDQRVRQARGQAIEKWGDWNVRWSKGQALQRSDHANWDKTKWDDGKAIEIQAIERSGEKKSDNRKVRRLRGKAIERPSDENVMQSRGQVNKR